jgi:hypothetical protein
LETLQYPFAEHFPTLIIQRRLQSLNVLYVEQTQQLNTRHLHQRGDEGLTAWYQYQTTVPWHEERHLPHRLPSEFMVYKRLFYWAAYGLLLASDLQKKLMSCHFDAVIVDTFHSTGVQRLFKHSAFYIIL